MGFIVRWLRLMPLAGLALLAPAQERGAAAPILERLERNMSFRTAYVEAEVVITAKNRVSAKTFFAYLEGTERTWVEYVSPARDRGLRVLRTADDLRIYLPSARKVMKIRNGRRQRRGYADFSFDDVAELAVDLRGQFASDELAAEMFAGRPCHLLRLVAKVPGRTYPLRKMWVDAETAVCLRIQFFTRSGTLARELTAADVRPFATRFYPTRFVMVDRLRKGAQTEIVLKKIVFDVELPPGIFDAANLIPAAVSG
jgi:outer membrane lipoprotein-sorting protein